jgi:repressor LexA
MASFWDLTERQKEVLKFMKQFQKKENCNPSLAEIADHFDCAVNNSYQHVKKLHEKGYVEQTPRGYRAK